MKRSASLATILLACHSKSVPDAGPLITTIASSAPSEIASAAPSASVSEAPIASASVSASPSIAAPAPKGSDPLQAYKDEEEARRQILQAFGNGVSLTDASFPLTGGSGMPYIRPRGSSNVKPDVQIVSVEAGGVADAQRTVTSMRPGFRVCYNKGVEADPKMTGMIRLRVNVRANGEVESATKEMSSGLSADVEQCIIRRLKVATFSPPGIDGTTVIVTLRLDYNDPKQ